MTRTHATCLFTLVFLFSPLMLEGKEKLDWRKGQLLAVTVQGHGSQGRRSVVWRTYCIETGDRVYSALSKRRARMNLEVNGPVRFATAGTRLYVVDRKGRTHVLRNLRREPNAERCAKRSLP